MNPTLSLSKAVLLAALGAACMTTTAYADTPVSTATAIHCPSIATLNSILQTQGANGIENFVDQGVTWLYSTPYPIGKGPFQSFDGVSIPTKLGKLTDINCIYHATTAQPDASTVYLKSDNEKGPFKGVTGDWSIVPAQSACISTRADGCTFSKDNV